MELQPAQTVGERRDDITGRELPAEKSHGGERMSNTLRFYDVTFFCDSAPGVMVKPSRQDDSNPWKCSCHFEGSGPGSRGTITMFFQSRDDLKAMSDELQRAVEALPREGET